MTCSKALFMDAMQCCSAAEAEEAGVAERGDMEEGETRLRTV